MARKKRRRPGKTHGSRFQETPTISVCMIARDEAAFLAQCLESVHGLADEVVVGDTGSSDSTREVAEQGGARVIDVEWEGDFAAARNAVLAAAHGDWILVLDCDEVLAREDWPAIRKAVDRGRAAGFRMTTRNYVRTADRVGFQACRGEYAQEKEYPGWFPTTKVRLFRNDPRIRFEGALHELVEGSLRALSVKVGTCAAQVHHYGYVEKARPTAEYAEAARKKAEAAPEDPEAAYELALARRDAGDWEGAREAIGRCAALLEAHPTRTGHYLRRDFVFLVEGEVLDRLGDRAGAERAYHRALEADPGCFQALNNLGTLVQRAGDLDGALAYYERALALAPGVETVRENVERVRAARHSRRDQPAVGETGAGRLSVCLIARDEEAALGRCLESVREVADEIVVVDTGSRDGTVRVAERFGAKVGYFAWRDDFAAARNASLALATGDWILWMDADEVLLPDDREKVRRAKALTRDRALLFTLVNEGGERSRFQQVKMFPNRPEVRFERPVHETVIPSLKRLGLAVSATDVEVRHTGYADADAAARKQAFYLKLMEAWLKEHPEDLDLWFRVGYTRFTQGRFAEAERDFGRVLEAGREAVEPASLFRAAAVFQGRCLVEAGKYEAAAARLEEALEMKPDDALAHLSLGEAYVGLGRRAQAVAQLERALSGEVDPNVPMDAEAVAAAARRLLAESDGAGEGEPVRPRLSLCMIVKNEADRLGRCLESVQGLVDEIVLVDTGSEDGTVEVARRFGARLGYFPWCDDFAAARNASLALATGEWILWLDADDIMQPEFHAEIRGLLSGGRDKAYFFLLDSQGFDRASCLQLRLFPNLPGVAFSMPVHEQVTPSLNRLGIRCEATGVKVTHTGYTTQEVVRGKQEKYLRIMERWLETHPDDYIVRSHAAMTYYIQGDLDRAISNYERILERSDCRKDRNLVIETTSVLYLGRCYMRKGEFERALGYLLEARRLDDRYAVTNLTLGECYTKMGRPEEAMAALEQAEAFEDQVTFSANDPRVMKYSIRFFKGQNLEALGRPEAAASCYRQAAEADSSRSGALGALSTVCRKMGLRAEAVAAIEEALQRSPDNPKHRFNRGTFYLEAGDTAEAERWFRWALEADPEMPEPYLNLGYMARRRRDLKTAEEMYRKAGERAPESPDAPANLGHLLLEQGRYAEAGDAFSQVRRVRAGFLDVDLGLCAALAGQGRTEAVPPLLDGVLQSVYGGALQATVPAEAEARDLAQLLSECGRMLLGRRMAVCARLGFMAAHLLDPDSVEIGLKLAEIYRATGEAWRAVSVYEDLIRKFPSEPELFRRLGTCYEAMGVPEASAMCAEQVGRLQGN